MDDPRAKQQINSILQLDLDTITFSDIHWRYGNGYEEASKFLDCAYGL